MGTDERPHGYEREYTETGFWDSMLRYAKLAGREVVEKALQLYYLAQTPEVPGWARAVIYGALGYFITPIDAIPDLTPIVGYTDDLGVLVASMATVMGYVTPEVMERAAQKAREWF